MKKTTKTTNPTPTELFAAMESKHVQTLSAVRSPLGIGNEFLLRDEEGRCVLQTASWLAVLQHLGIHKA